MRPTLPTASVNHIAPSGPAVISVGPLLAVGVGNRLVLPPVVMRPIAFTFVVKSSYVNHRLPSGPAEMPFRKSSSLPGPRMVNRVIVPEGGIRPILDEEFVPSRVNQRLPSGAVAMSSGVPLLIGTRKVVNLPAGVIFTIR